MTRSLRKLILTKIKWFGIGMFFILIFMYILGFIYAATILAAAIYWALVVLLLIK